MLMFILLIKGSLLSHTFGKGERTAAAVAGVCQQLCINWWSYCWFNPCYSSSPQEETTTRAGRALGFWGHVRADGWIFRVCVCVCVDSHRHGSKQQCNARTLKIESYFTVIVKLKECKETTLGSLFLPGFSKLFEQTGSVLVPPSSKPPLHLPFWMAGLLAKTLYGSLTTNRSKLRVLFSTKHTWCGHSNSYLRRIFGNFTVVGL